MVVKCNGCWSPFDGLANHWACLDYRVLGCRFFCRLWVYLVFIFNHIDFILDIHFYTEFEIYINVFLTKKPSYFQYVHLLKDLIYSATNCYSNIYSATNCCSNIYQQAIYRFRVSSHRLGIELGRHHKPRLPVEQRLCFFCNSRNLDDELHFIINCEFHTNAKKTVYSVLNANIWNLKVYRMMVNSGLS